MRTRTLASLLAVIGLLGVGLAGPAAATSDTSPPVLHAIGVTGVGPFTAGDTVTVQWVATDDASVSAVHVQYLDSVGHERVLVGDGSSGQVVIDHRWSEGPVAVQAVWLFDSNDNFRVYRPDGSWGSSPSDSGTHAVDLDAAGFTTVATGADDLAPTLTTFSRTSSASVAGGQAVTFGWSAQDEHDYGLQVLLTDEVCKSHTVNGNGQSNGSSSTVVDAGWADGDVAVSQVQLSDDSGNLRVYEADGTQQWAPSANGPWTTGTHSFDLEALAFATHDTGSDTSPPVLTDAHVASTGPFTEGDVVDLVWTASDPHGVSTVGVRLVDAAGKAHYGWKAQDGKLAVTIDASWAVGQVHADEVVVQDPLYNNATYRRDGRLDVSPSCDASATHALDLSALDFVVEAEAPLPVDTTPPTAKATPFTPRTTLSTTAPVRFGASDSESGVASYDVRYTTATATSGFTPWQTPASWQGTSSTQLVSPYLAPGRTFCFAVRARDVAGNLSAWTPSTCVTRAYDDAVAKPAAGWSRVWSDALYGGSASRTTRYAGTSSTGTVTVRRIAVVATTCPSCGTVAVYAGGQLVGKVNLASSTTLRRRILALPLISTRTGVVTVKVLSSGRLVELDGLVLSRT